jgi:hypothetical protein
LGSPPFFGHPVETVTHSPEACLKLQSTGLQRRAAVIAERTPHGRTIALDDLGLLILPALHRPLQGPDPAHPFLELLLRVPIRLPHRPRGLTKVMKVTQLMGDTWKDLGHGVAHRALPVAHYPHHRHLKPPGRFPQQRYQIILCRGEQAPCQQHLPPEHFPHHPQDFMTHLRLQAINGEDEAPLRLQPFTPRRRLAHRERHKFVIPFQQIGDVALTDAHPPFHQRPVDLRNTPMPLIA